MVGNKLHHPIPTNSVVVAVLVCCVVNQVCAPWVQPAPSPVASKAEAEPGSELPETSAAFEAARKKLSTSAESGASQFAKANQQEQQKAAGKPAVQVRLPCVSGKSGHGYSPPVFACMWNSFKSLRGMGMSLTSIFVRF